LHEGAYDVEHPNQEILDGSLARFVDVRRSYFIAPDIIGERPDTGVRSADNGQPTYEPFIYQI